MLQHSVLHLVFDSVAPNLSAGISSYRGKFLMKHESSGSDDGNNTSSNTLVITILGTYYS